MSTGINKFVRNPRFPGRQAFDPDIKVMFGLKAEQKWPEQGMTHRNIDGIRCWVDPIVIGKFTIRAKCLCPICGKAMPIGRLEQHSKVHKDITG